MAPLWEDGRGEGVCPICQELPKGAVSTDCGHLFCRGCLAQHVAKASASGVLCCPLCRKPCSEGVLGAAHLCPRHQKKVSYFCEESRRLLCAQCLGSPEHQGHRELAIESAVSHYKERLGRRSRRLRRDLRELRRLRAQQEEQPRAGQQQDTLVEQRPDPPGDTPAARIPDISRAIAQLSSLVSALEKTIQGLGVDTLKEASELLDRSAPQKLEALYLQVEKRAQTSIPPPSAAPACSFPGHLVPDSPPPPGSPSLRGGPVYPHPPSPERDPLCSSPRLGPDA
ncbi:E3 ubiquitin ligase TRIM40 [Ursus arctos]|uniref:E3 ubiquitin ligase TRIM40 n=1 Tax=Ursus arctos TaxID=9644 RepID=UPI0020171083|nr:E3 ubiquitin ligase TRIM40 [Ursus arctos]